jgi:hypothetical protein
VRGHISDYTDGNDEAVDLDDDGDDGTPCRRKRSLEAIFYRAARRQN